jgi:hypothetical protein
VLLELCTVLMKTIQSAPQVVIARVQGLATATAKPSFDTHRLDGPARGAALSLKCFAFAHLVSEPLQSAGTPLEPVTLPPASRALASQFVQTELITSFQEPSAMSSGAP